MPKQVPIPIVCCNVCNKQIKIIPDFIVKGTTLTLLALAFIAFAYESSPALTWRDLPAKFCDENDQIAHSTLYKAVHGMGESLLKSPETQKLSEKYWSFPDRSTGNRHAETLGWPASKSRYPHTIKRENAVRNILTALLSIMLLSFIDFFLRYIDNLSWFLRALNRSPSELYPRKSVKYINTS